MDPTTTHPADELDPVCAGSRNELLSKLLLIDSVRHRLDRACHDCSSRRAKLTVSDQFHRRSDSPERITSRARSRLMSRSSAVTHRVGSRSCWAGVTVAGAVRRRGGGERAGSGRRCRIPGRLSQPTVPTPRKHLSFGKKNLRERPRKSPELSVVAARISV